MQSCFLFKRLKLCYMYYRRSYVFLFLYVNSFVIWCLSDHLFVSCVFSISLCIFYFVAVDRFFLILHKFDWIGVELSISFYGQILVVNSSSRPETIFMTNTNLSRSSSSSDQRYMVEVVERLNRDLGLLHSNLDHVTARICSLETNMDQMTSRMNTLDYLFQVLFAREESWVDRKLKPLALPIITCASIIMMLYSRRRWTKERTSTNS